MTRDNRTRLEVWNDNIKRLTEVFEDENKNIFHRIDAGLELQQFYGQDRVKQALMINRVRSLIWNEAVR
jgi:hypothetical protein